MPQNKNKSRSNNKHQKNRSQQASGNSSNRGDVNAVQSSRTSNVTVPNFEAFQTDTAGYTATRSSCPINTSSESIYARYKKSTQRFKEALQSMVPSALFQSDRVSSLMDAADYIAKQGIEVKGSLLADLKLSIRVRNKVASATYGGGDEGHTFFILVLAYCWSVLVPLRKSAPPKQNVCSVSTPSKLSNRFANLCLSKEEDDETDSEDDLPSQPVLRPVEDTLPKRQSLQEFLSATDVMCCRFFLYNLDELMGYNASQFSKLRKISSHFQEKEYPPSLITKEMMKASVMTNSAIQLVSTLEQEFIHEFPHLNTVYRFLACLILSEQIEELTKTVTLDSTNASMFTKHHAIEFLGDSLECAFRNSKSDPTIKKSTLVDDFVLCWKLNEKDIIQDMFDGLILIVLLEVPIHQETGTNKEMLRRERENIVGITSHNWLPHSFIGKGRSILHTIRLLQSRSNIICDNDSKQGSFGPQWDSTLHKRATRIAVEMDELLLGDIMPSLINMCSEGLLSDELPREQELLPLFCQIKLSVKYPQSPVTWSLAFSVHSILNAIYEIHNACHFKFLADAAQQSFDEYFSQVEWATEIEKTNIKRQSPQWEVNLKRLLAMRMLTQVPMRHLFSEKQIQCGVWNPLCAGTFLLYITYYCNIEGGMEMIDSIAQLRAFLHLYNALIKTKAIKRGDLEYLDWLNEVFCNSKHIWEGPLPELGKFQLRWWISTGIKIEEAQRRCDISIAAFSSDSTKAPQHYNNCRRMTPIAPESMSKSYRRLCMRDYHDVVDIYSSERQKFEHKDSELYAHAVRVKDTLDAIDDEQKFLATNWIILGLYLNQSYIGMFNLMGYGIERIIKETQQQIRLDRRTNGRSVRSSLSWKASEDNLKYFAMSSLFAERVLGALDRGDRDVARECAEYMKTLPDSVLWFVLLAFRTFPP